MERAENTELELAQKHAQEYNASIVPGAVSEEAYSQEALLSAAVDYKNQLNVLGDGTMGYIEIPKIHVLLPIFHGTEADTLERGVGHLLGSSLPVGGESTHTILSGHSGMASQAMFTDLEQLAEGDVFFLQILGETLAYQVTELNTVLPQDTSRLGIIPGKDLCTLVTCVPYGVNTHRLLVTGERIDYEEAAEVEEETAREQDAGSTWEQKYIHGLLTGLAVTLGAVIFVLVAVQIWRKFSDMGGGRYAS